TETFDVTFSESVTQVDASDFTLVRSNNVSGTISSVTGSGTTYTVTVTGVTGDGTMRLDLDNSGTGINSSGTAITGGFTGGQSYTIDQPPTVVSITPSSTNPINSSGSVTYDVVFSKALQGLTAAQIVGETIASGVTIGVGNVSVAAVSSTEYRITYSNLTGTGTIQFAVPVSGITDTAGTQNTVADSGATITIDNTAPTVTSIVRAGSNPSTASSDSFTVTFSEAVSGVARSDFTAVTGGTVGDSGLSVTGSGTTWTVTVNDVTGTGTLGLNLNNSGTGITDAAGNAIPAGLVGEVYAVIRSPNVTAGGTVSYEIGGPTIALDSGLIVTDADGSTELTGATVSISAADYQTGDVLNFTNQGSITGSYDAGTRTLTLTGTASVADYQTALDSIAFSTTSLQTGTRTIGWTATDAVGTSAQVTSTVDVLAGPAVTAGGSVTFDGGGSPVTLDATLTLADQASSTLAGAT
ncbi:MAG: Ig-like domain-containing protein, partial [Mycobacterium sp.]|nr:Ig-like domain-containing protein [Mycobacterium sp.]